MAMREVTSHSFVDTSRRSVLLATGLATPGFALLPLQERLKSEGYDADTAYPHSFLNLGLGSNNEVKEAAEKLRERNGGEPIAGVGWSLGGRQLMEVAFADPSLIDLVITLGSPCRLVRAKPDEVTVVSFVGRNGRWFDGALPAFFTSRGDHETVKVRSNHYRLPFSTEVFDAIAHRLGQAPKDQDRPSLAIVR